MLLLCILDGFGIRKDEYFNAVRQAKKPNLDNLFATCPNTTINGSGLAVGLPEGQMGNSEVGHLNFGAGRVVYQDVTRIDKSISDGDFFENKIFLDGFQKTVENNVAVHLFGLISDGCVHSSLVHLKALVKMAKDNGVTKLYLHAFMDGRDTPPHSGAGYMKEVVDYFTEAGLGKVASVQGRYYGMDRDKRWERVEKGYDAIVRRKGAVHSDPIAVIKESYKNDVTDEFIIPTTIDFGNDEGRLSDGDVALFFNFRADRVRQICHILTGDDPPDFPHPGNPNVHLITMTSYDKELTKAHIAFPPVHLNNILGEVVSKAGMKQLRIAETEKYAHVTFFFNGGVEKPFENEDRKLISSPKVATYDLQPEMSSVEVTDNVVERVLSEQYDMIILNFANCDMVGHTGVMEAAVKAVEAVDAGVGRIIEAIQRVKGQMLITADHGNAEQMWDETTNGPFTAHTTNPVPFIFYDSTGQFKNIKLREGGKLADVAPTILQCLNLKQPADMTGESMFISGEVPVYRN
ncbi:MAG: 2,3-bisphosphoglycerate-independent phosphoglycerate mutase [Candidatus Zixiibacteriota bacterium]